ncbi:DNA repair protein SWI5 homolog [Discoglossus pictus]
MESADLSSDDITGRLSPARSSKLESPGSQREPTPGASLTPRPRAGLRRTPLRAGRSCNAGFKSPVQSLCSGQSPGYSQDSVQKEISELKKKEEALDAEIEELQAEGYSLAEVEEHISLLHQYNELKDAGQMLMGRLAVLRGVTTKDLYGEFGLEMED